MLLLLKAFDKQGCAYKDNYGNSTLAMYISYVLNMFYRTQELGPIGKACLALETLNTLRHLS